MEQMSFEEFKQAVADNIKDYLPQKYEDSQVDIRQVLKNNDTVLDGLSIASPDSNVSPTIYLNNYYKQYQNGADVDQIIGDIADVYIANAVDKDMDVSIITNFDKAKDHIFPKLVNAEENQELLANRPHQLLDDLAVTYQVQMNDSGALSVAVTNQIMEVYGVTQEELHEVALANLQQQTPHLQSLIDVVKEAAFRDVVDALDGDVEEANRVIEGMFPPEPNPIYVLSNEEKLNGAAEALNEKAMEMVSEQVGSDFYILPSSIHELLIVPKEAGMELSDLENMVQQVNMTQVSPEERLSDHVYEYDSREKELFRADRAEEHEQKVERKHQAEQGHKRVSVKEKMSEMKEKVSSINKENEKSHEKKKELALG